MNILIALCLLNMVSVPLSAGLVDITLPSDILEDVSRNKVEEEIRRGKIISYTQVSSSSFKVLTFEMIKKASKKVLKIRQY